jgi:hypothetical protein
MLAQKLRSTETSGLSETQSLQAVKSMLQVSLQEIAWSRSFLPKSMFIEKKMAGFADVKIHQLHSSDTKDAKMFESWMQNISDLLKNNRLSSVIFGSHDDADKPDNFSEMFEFHIEDTSNFSKIQKISVCRGSSSTKICSSASKEDIRSSATSMIRSLETLLGTLPSPSSTQKFMSIKLIARDQTNLSSQDFSAESGFSCGMQITTFHRFLTFSQCSIDVLIKYDVYRISFLEIVLTSLSGSPSENSIVPPGISGDFSCAVGAFASSHQMVSLNMSGPSDASTTHILKSSTSTSNDVVAERNISPFEVFEWESGKEAIRKVICFIRFVQIL